MDFYQRLYLESRIVATLQQILPFGSVVVIVHCMLKLIVDSANGRSEHQNVILYFFWCCCCSHWTCDWRQFHLIPSNSDFNNVYGLASCVRLKELSWFDSWFSDATKRSQPKCLDSLWSTESESTGLWHACKRGRAASNQVQQIVSNTWSVVYCYGQRSAKLDFDRNGKLPPQTW